MQYCISFQGKWILYQNTICNFPQIAMCQESVFSIFIMVTSLSTCQACDYRGSNVATLTNIGKGLQESNRSRNHDNLSNTLWVRSKYKYRLPSLIFIMSIIMLTKRHLYWDGPSDTLFFQGVKTMVKLSYFYNENHHVDKTAFILRWSQCFFVFVEGVKEVSSIT